MTSRQGRKLRNQVMVSVVVVPLAGAVDSFHDRRFFTWRSRSSSPLLQKGEAPLEAPAMPHASDNGTE
eukprot:CAMPEP_0195154586 /NCGR_PEP_ID=MMETSP0448-20130528/183727_1 /TAXON_ID=66468 /ORGANISM="Heterocapsa triquestra, Strain CCMP 448" /LENGTH=67 /DNA_ID=CAMNT_0040193363 /DNA_START=1730 /DNA_END=1933 /DNA_ORIENTATION=+